MNQFSANSPRCAVPSAIADIQGSPAYPNLHGRVKFYRRAHGVLVQVELEGLPTTPGDCEGHFFGFHLHSGNSCSGTAAEPFANAGSHYNPDGCGHPYHAGDFPPLLGCRGSAWAAFLTDRFQLSDVIGRSVIVHEQPDDFHTQPSGDAGAMIGCGIVKWVRRS